MRNKGGKTEHGLGPVPALIFGVLLALGLVLILLLLGAGAISRGVLQADCAPQLTVAACLCGCLTGGLFTCHYWMEKRVLAGLAVGVLGFGCILLAALLGGQEIELDGHALAELAGCLLGGGLAGLFSRRAGKKRRKARR